ncbi:ArsR/SmtB family transcription factor [Salmonella enterica]
MLSSLMDSNHLTASELAYLSGLSAQSTSNHLSKLLYFKVVTFEKVGRNRYYRLYNQLVAQAIESMMAALILILLFNSGVSLQDSKNYVMHGHAMITLLGMLVYLFLKACRNNRS